MNELGEGVLGSHRPHSNLLTYYLLESLLLGPLFPLILVPRFLRYRTLRYEFDDEGVSMRWGALFQREISLTYGRIQDIHLASNVVERRLGLARVQVQTASGSAAAEMTIEGLRQFDRVRDFLYSRMRGARGLAPTTTTAAPGDEVTAALVEAAAELRALRLALADRDGPPAATAAGRTTTGTPATASGDPPPADGAGPGEPPG